ncbi:hypothetical protein SISSUDRAFT_1105274, partial [Sistotremastrum suecicum HHB10207 ss-3]
SDFPFFLFLLKRPSLDRISSSIPIPTPVYYPSITFLHIPSMPRAPRHHYQQVADPHPPPGPVLPRVKTFSRNRLEERAAGYHARGINTVEIFNQYFADFLPLAEKCFAYGGITTRQITSIFLSALPDRYRTHFRDALGSQPFTDDFHDISRIHRFYETARAVFPVIATHTRFERNFATMRQFPPEYEFHSETYRGFAYLVDAAFTATAHDPIITREHLTAFRQRIMDALRDSGCWDPSINEIVALHHSLRHLIPRPRSPAPPPPPNNFVDEQPPALAESERAESPVPDYSAPASPASEFAEPGPDANDVIPRYENIPKVTLNFMLRHSQSVDQDILDDANA